MFSRLSRSVVRKYASVAGLTAASFTVAACDFDAKGFPSALTFPGPKKTTPLSLAGVGMRRKNLYIMEVDVYLVGFYMGKDAIAAAKKWSAAQGSLQETLITDAFAGKGDPMAAVTLKFVRGVGQDAIVEAFNEAFKGLDPEAIVCFKEATKKAIGEKGMKEGEEFSFFWFGDSNGLVVAKNGAAIEQVPNTKAVKELEKRLLGVYLDNKTSVSPELVKSVTDNYGQ